VVHHCKRLALIGEAGEYLAGVHSQLHYLQGYMPSNGFALFSQVHSAHTALA